MGERGRFDRLFADCLEDGRVRVEIADVGRIIREATGVYDAILLDVDNGPDGLSGQDNDELYGPRGLGAARRALHHDGLLAIWSAHRDNRFMQRLRAAGFTVTQKSPRATHGGRGAKHVVWLAQRT